jgi:hypothetical protein
MGQIFDFEHLDQQNMKLGQDLVNVSASVNKDSSPVPTTAELTRIFSASIGSLAMAFFFFILSQSSMVNAVTATEPVFTLAGQVILAGAALALGVVLFTGIPLAVVAWRSTPSSRFLLCVPFIAVLLPMIVLILAISGATIASFVVLYGNLSLTIAVWRLTPPPRIRLLLLIPFLATALLLFAFILSILLNTLLGPFSFIGPIGSMIGRVLLYDIPIIGNLGNLLVSTLICGTPIISTIAINRGMQQATIPDKWLRFARLPSRLVVFALVVMFLGLLFWGFYLAILAPGLFFTLLSPLNAPWNSWLLILIGMLISVIVAGWAVSSHR